MNNNNPHTGAQEVLTCRSRIGKEWNAFRLLIQSVPTMLTVAFVMSVVLMNLLANKSINLPVSWLALDCGLVVSWFAFLVLDMITKHFGPKAATQLSLFAMAINLAICLVFFIVSRIPGSWSASYVPGAEGTINSALDATFGGSWYVIWGSAVAFTVSAAVNNFLNDLVGRAFRKNPNSMVAYLSRSYVSTAVGQFTDNMTFALLVSHVFFGWSLLQCVTCSLFGMLMELVCQSVFSVFGYWVCEKWRNNHVGEAYLELARSAG